MTAEILLYMQISQHFHNLQANLRMLQSQYAYICTHIEWIDGQAVREVQTHCDDINPRQERSTRYVYYHPCEATVFLQLRLFLLT